MTKLRRLLTFGMLMITGMVYAVNIEWSFDNAAIVRLPASFVEKPTVKTFNWVTWTWDDSKLLPPVGFLLLFK